MFEFSSAASCFSSENHCGMQVLQELVLGMLASSDARILNFSKFVNHLFGESNLFEYARKLQQINHK